MKLPRLPHQGARSRELDFVRGIAILLVMGVHFFSIDNNVWLYHAIEFPGRQFGGSGVDLFFVLSGFLVGGLLLKEYKQTGKLKVGTFIFRRGFKIWPAYYVFILFEVAAHAHPLKTFLWQNLFHLQNYAGSSILHTWTLSLEEHFYLFLALLMGFMTARQWHIDRILKVFGGIMVAVFLIRTLTVAMGWPGAMQFTHNRVDSLLMGVVLASLFHFYPERFDALARRPLPLAGITTAVVLFMVFVKNEAIRNSIGFTIIYIGAAAFLLLVFTHSGKIKNSWLYKFIAMIGVYSYAIYLYHVSVRTPSLKIAQHFPHALQWPAIMLIQFAAALVLGIVTTQIVEWPFLRIRNKLFPQKVRDIGGPGEGDTETEPAEPVAVQREGAPRALKLTAIVLSVGFIFFCLADIGLGAKLGLGFPPLYISDRYSSYALKPNQDLHRFGNRIHINRWGMRSEDLPDQPKPGVCRILFLGDSVVWGGAYEDQSTTFPYVVAAQLGHVETLNPSCGGWAPSNELGWLQEHGTYGSELAVLVYNDGDLFQAKAPDIAGKNPSYPKKSPAFALQELISRYVLPKFVHVDSRDPGNGQDPETPEAGQAVNEAVRAEIRLAKQDGAKVTVLFVKRNPTAKVDPFHETERPLLQRAVEAEGVQFVLANLPDRSFYHDEYHPSPKGNKAIADQLAPVLRNAIAEGR